MNNNHHWDQQGFHLVHSLEDDAWKAFVDNHPQGNIFHTPEMFEVFKHTQGYRPSLWAVRGSDGQILALMLPVEITLSNVFRRLTSRNVVYGSILYEQSEKGKEALEMLLKAYIQKTGGKPLFTELRNISDLSPIQSLLQKCGFSYEDHLNYLINLDHPVDAVFQNIGQRTRKNIRKAINRGEVQIEVVRDLQQMDDCYQLIWKTYRAASVPPPSKNMFEAAYDVLGPKEMVRFTLARVNGVPVAVSADLLYKHVIYGWYGGMDRAYSAYSPNELLTWHILKWGAEQGYHVYDFGGAGKPDEKYGVRDFKAKFGGQLVCYGRNTYVHNPITLSISKVGYQIYQGIVEARTS